MRWSVFTGESLVAGYLLASLGLGVLFKSKADSIEGFLVANRSMGKWLLAFTFGATYFSSVVIVVGGMWGYLWGAWSLVIPVLNVILGVYFTFNFIGKKIAVIGAESGSLTIPELAARLGGGRGMRLYLAAMAAVGLTIYAATVASGAAVMVSSVMHMGLESSALLVVAIIGAYVVMSGMYGIVWTDALQGIVMALGVALLLTAAIGHGGSGMDTSLFTRVSKSFPGLDLLLDIAVLTSVAVWGLPQLLNRFYTVRDEETVGKAGLVALVFASIVTFGSYITGIIARSVLPPGTPPPKVVPLMAQHLLGAVGSSIIAAAIIAASMSTMDSIGLTVGSALAYDILGRRDTRSVRAFSGLMMAAVLGLVALIFSAPQNLAGSLTHVFKLGWSITGVAFIPSVIAITTGRGSPARIVAGSLAGTGIVLVYGIAGLLGFSVPLHNLSFTIAATIASLIVLSSGKREKTP